MGNALALLILFIILPLCLWLYYRANATDRSASRHKSIGSFHGVSIKSCSNACANVKKLKGIRFLASQVSPLPLSECTCQTCTCTYVHHQDRRDDEDRRFPSGIMNNLFESKEQRLSDDDRRNIALYKVISP